jgi:hypothetical protein
MNKAAPYHRTALVLVMLAFAVVAEAASNDFPKLKPGEWEFTREGFNGPANAQNLSVRECLDPAQSMREQNAMLAQAGCRFDPVQAKGNVYTYVAQCDIPNVGKTRSVSVLTRQSESAYTVKVDSEGEINGKPMKTSELLTARRVGNCKIPKAR